LSWKTTGTGSGQLSFSWFGDEGSGGAFTAFLRY
jgi:hypothetical protein